jgi:hypothetical protein
MNRSYRHNSSEPPGAQSFAENSDPVLKICRMNIVLWLEIIRLSHSAHHFIAGSLSVPLRPWRVILINLGIDRKVEYVHAICFDTL